VGAAGQAQQPLPQLDRLVDHQERQRRLGLGPADDLQPQLGQAEHARHERPDQLDRLQPLDRMARVRRTISPS
jgi:hypothetical protein